MKFRCLLPIVAIVLSQAIAFSSTVPNGADLSPLIASAAPHETIECVLSGHYTLSETTTCKSDWVTVNLHGSTLDARASPGAAGNLV